MTQDSDILIELNEVSKSFGANEILKDVSFSVSRGEIVTLIGPNGAGKSTAMRIALSLLKADKGTITRAGNISIGYMPQNIAIDHSLPLSVIEFLKLRPGTGKKECLRVLSIVGASHVINNPIQTVSGGEMQRILLARAIIGKPDLLVLDEPVQGVDVIGQEAIYALISNLKSQFNCGILMISHDLHLVMSETDKVVCLNGHVCCSGAPEHVQNTPEYQALVGNTVGRGISFYKHNHDHTHDTFENDISCKINNEHVDHD